MAPATLSGWLEYIERQHPKTIEMGLERVARVRDALGARFTGALITVGGTNGKGSTCAMLESMYRAAGYRVGLYTSPHLLRYNERVRIDGIEVPDTRLAESFARIEAVRGDTPLTYFEFGTLVAWEIFCASSLDVLILEVGLGGRLDAVNVFDPDCAVVVSIGIDHTDYLGETRELISFEKAGIYRPGKVAICADAQPPQPLIDHAHAIGATLWLINRDFGCQGARPQWRYWGPGGARAGLAPPALRGTKQLVNASAALAAIDALRERVPVNMQAVREGLALVELPGRFQVMPGRPSVVLDVAHNVEAARVLASNLGDQGFFENTRAVFGMLSDKDIEGVCQVMSERVDEWHIAALTGPRAASTERLAAAISATGTRAPVILHANPVVAYCAARESSRDNDRIVTFGSFLTVTDVMAYLQASRSRD
jgi:dihydrofolate synthase / folylpolyglutamate synthase